MKPHPLSWPLAGLLALATLVAVPGVAQAAPCSGTSGVTVLVQYDGGPTQVGCAQGDPATGYDALRAAGFSVRLAQGNGAGALCQINSYPSNTACASMPAVDEYWAYFHAQPGGHWAYSTEGGGTYDPVPGSVEGWRFKGNEDRPPSSKPPFVAASKPTPTKKPSVRPAHPTATPKASGSASGSTSPTASPSASGSPTLASSTAPPSPTATDTAQAFDEPGPIVPAEHGSSGGASWIWGVLLVVVLAAVGGVVAIRRRQG